jgi:hypothetical protein
MVQMLERFTQGGAVFGHGSVLENLETEVRSTSELPSLLFLRCQDRSL